MYKLNIVNTLSEVQFALNDDRATLETIVEGLRDNKWVGIRGGDSLEHHINPAHVVRAWIDEVNEDEDA